MKNATNRWLDRLAAEDIKRGGTGTDYKLAQLLEVNRANVSNWRRGLNQMDDDTALNLAERLDVRPIIVIAEIASERARSERTKNFWQRAAVGIGKTVILAGAMGAASSGISSPQTPFPLTENRGPAMYIMLNRRRARRRSIPRYVPGRVVPLSTGAQRATA